MKFPVIIKHRRSEATIYAKSEKYPYYRLAYRAAGKRIVRSFPHIQKPKQKPTKWSGSSPLEIRVWRCRPRKLQTPWQSATP